jgi:hypothetical protein
LVLGVAEAMVRAVVASCGREERMIDEDRFSGILEGDSDGIVSVIAVTVKGVKAVAGEGGQFSKRRGDQSVTWCRSFNFGFSVTRFVKSS